MEEQKGKLLYEAETYAIRGAVFDVYKEMGCGYLEAVYHECLRLEFEAREVPFVDRANIHIHYKGRRLEQFYTPDFLCFGTILIELKAVKALAPEHTAQLMNYLKATGHRLGLLVNFGHYPQVQIERIIR